VEIGGEGKKIPSGLPCPSCTNKPVGRLGRHGSYLRTFKSFSGLHSKLPVLRLLCSKCRKSHACLFEHWLPYKRCSIEAQAQLVEPYLFEEMSYDQVGWAVSADEGEGHRHLAFTVVARLCQMRQWITSFAERQRHRVEGSLWRREKLEAPGDCPNAYKAKKKDKRAALNQVKEALEKLKKLNGDKWEGLLGQLHAAAMCLRTPVSLFTWTRAIRISTPHNRGDALF